MLISVADFIESGIECMLTQFSLRKADGGGGARFGLKAPEFCSRWELMTSSFSPLAADGAEDTAVAGVKVAGGDA